MGPRPKSGRDCHGIASIIRPGPNGKVNPASYCFKVSAVPSPADAIVFADQAMMCEMSVSEVKYRNGAFGVPGSSTGWRWPYDSLTRRHDGKASVSLADGHVALVPPSYWRDPAHFDPLQSTPSLSVDAGLWLTDPIHWGGPAHSDP